MTRTLARLSAVTLLAAAAHAQCYSTPAVGPVTLVPWSSANSYSATFVAQDEGLTNVPIDLSPAFGAAGFPMPGAIGVLNRMWINSNGEVYLTDATQPLLEPVGAPLYGVNTLAEARGTVAGASPRIFPLGGDHRDSSVTGAAWSITCDVTAGMVKVSWTDMSRFANTTDQFDFACTLLASGAVLFEYGDTFPATGFTGRYVGISIGNQVGSTSSPSRDLIGGVLADSGAEGLLYENFTTGNPFDLNGRSVLITPNGSGGYLSTLTCEPASHADYGVGCHSYVGPDTGSLFQLFADAPSAKAVLDGNAMLFTLAGNGYVATWLPGVAPALYVPPSGAATIVADADDTTSTIVPSAAIPVPVGVEGTWTISSNGVLTAGNPGNQGADYTPTLAETATATRLAFYTWCDHSPAESGSGKVKWEEVAGVVYVTFDGVEWLGGTPTVAPSTFQWQINMASGDVTMLWPSFTVSNETDDVLVGCTLAGASSMPTSQTLSSVTATLLTPAATLTPMTLSAAPAPVINPSTVVTYTAANLNEFVPGSGVYIATTFLSLLPNPAGFDLSLIGLTTVPGCNAYIGSLDVDLGGVVSLTPTATWNVTFSTPTFAPGNTIAAQTVSLFDPSFPLPNGEAGGFLLSNGVLSVTQPN